MAVYPKLIRLRVSEGEPAVIRARVTNDAGASVHWDGTPPGLRTTDMHVRVYDVAVLSTAVLSQDVTKSAASQPNCTWTEATKRLDRVGALWSGAPYLGFLSTQTAWVTATCTITGGTGAVPGVYVLTEVGVDYLIFQTSIGAGANGQADIVGFVTVTSSHPYTTALATGYVTTEWTLDGTGYNFELVVEPAGLTGGDWVAGHKYRVEARISTGAVTGVSGEGQGDQFVVSEVSVDGMVSV